MATKVSYGWIETGSDKSIGTVASRTRMNIVGAIDLSNMQVISHEYETTNSENIIKFLRHIKSYYEQAKRVHLILDQAGYNKSEMVKNFAKENKIQLHYLPPYSPNLNPIERLWKVMNETARNNVIFKNAGEFRERIRKFFAVDYPTMCQSLIDRITDNFRISTASSFWMGISGLSNYFMQKITPEKLDKIHKIEDALTESIKINEILLKSSGGKEGIQTKRLEAVKKITQSDLGVRKLKQKGRG